MIELTHSAYASLEINDPRYDDNERLIRGDVLKALALIHGTHKQLFGEKYGPPSVTVYCNKKRVFIKYRWPQKYHELDVIYGILRKDEIYEAVLGMVMDGRSKG
jgi:hypothetical protein